jgi:hypothetical protein
MLLAEQQAHSPRRWPITSIHQELVTRHGADGISYQMLRAYVSRHRATTHQQPLSPAHQAVAAHDLTRLRGFLDAGYDVEDDNGDGWTLLRRAIHAEAAGQARAGQPPARRHDCLPARPRRQPQQPGTSMPAEAEAEILRHWLAAEIIRAWSR